MTSCQGELFESSYCYLLHSRAEVKRIGQYLLKISSAMKFITFMIVPFHFTHNHDELLTNQFNIVFQISYCKKTLNYIWQLCMSKVLSKVERNSQLAKGDRKYFTRYKNTVPPYCQNVQFYLYLCHLYLFRNSFSKGLFFASRIKAGVPAITPGYPFLFERTSRRGRFV